MKKIILPFILIFVLSACGTSDESRRPDFCINSAVDIEYLQGSFSADVKTDASGSMAITVSSPESLRGITVLCSSDDISVQYGTLKLQCTNGYVPFTQLYKLVSFARNSVPDSVESKDSERVFRYSNDGDEYVFTADAETDRINKIETPECVYMMR